MLRFHLHRVDDDDAAEAETDISIGGMPVESVARVDIRCLPNRENRPISPPRTSQGATRPNFQVTISAEFPPVKHHQLREMLVKSGNQRKPYTLQRRSSYSIQTLYS